MTSCTNLLPGETEPDFTNVVTVFVTLGFGRGRERGREKERETR